MPQRTRISFCPNSGRNRSKVLSTVVFDFNDNEDNNNEDGKESGKELLCRLETLARNKLKIGKKKPIILFDRHRGTQLTEKNVIFILFPSSGRCRDNDNDNDNNDDGANSGSSSTQQPQQQKQRSGEDVILHVSTGEPFVSPQGNVKVDDNNNKDGNNSIPIEKPPRWPYPFGATDAFPQNNKQQHERKLRNEGNNDTKDSSISGVEKIPLEVSPVVVASAGNNKMSDDPLSNIIKAFNNNNIDDNMKNNNTSNNTISNNKSPFADLSGNVLKRFKDVARTNPYISVKHQDGNVVSVDYTDIAAFHGGKTTKGKGNDDASLLLQECRGLLLSSDDGRVLARRFHKFYNIHETSDSVNVDVRGAVLLEKLDGFLVSPYLAVAKAETEKTTTPTSGSAVVHWASRQQRSQYVEAMVQKLGSDIYEPFVLHWLSQGYTPIFECISSESDTKRPHKSIVSYKQDRLVLLAIRHNVSGYYLPWDEVVSSAKSFSDDLQVARLVKRISNDKEENLEEVVDHVRNHLVVGEKTEGVVMVLADGQRRYKIKTLWYLNNQKLDTAAASGGGMKHGTKQQRSGESSIPDLSINTWLVERDVETAKTTATHFSDIPSRSVWELALFDWLLLNSNDNDASSTAAAAGTEKNWDDIIAMYVGKMKSIASCPPEVFLYFMETIRSKIILLDQAMVSWANQDGIQKQPGGKFSALQLAQDVGWPSHLINLYIDSGAKRSGMNENNNNSNKSGDDAEYTNGTLKELASWIWNGLVRKSEWQALRHVLDIDFISLSDLYTDPTRLMNYLFGMEKIGTKTTVPATTPTTIILRGVSGSGKSHFVNSILIPHLKGMCAYRSKNDDDDSVAETSKRVNITVCSADDYFLVANGGRARREEQRNETNATTTTTTTIGDTTRSYQFDATRLQEAHDTCRHKFLSCLEKSVGANHDNNNNKIRNGREVVIIDNTNTTLKEYAYYKRHSKQRGCRVVVLEIHSRGPSQRSNVHGVPPEVIHAQQRRWEDDPDAMVVQNYMFSQ